MKVSVHDHAMLYHNFKALSLPASIHLHGKIEWICEAIILLHKEHVYMYNPRHHSKDNANTLVTRNPFSYESNETLHNVVWKELPRYKL